MNRSSNNTAQSNPLQTTSKTITRQIKFPSLMRGFTESLLFCAVFLASGYVSLGLPIVDMLAPMVPVVFLMMLCMVLSGVYRPEITNSIMNLYVHSMYGFVLGSVTFIVSLKFIAPEFAILKFVFFFLFFSFFVLNAMRPIISGTDFMDGGGRRTN
ncbi:MAG: hypothetical protein AB8B87_06235 [Granulosicoccus sp.]